MGFLSRRLVPRRVRRAAHPLRAARRAATPKALKKAAWATHPVDSAVYSMERTAATSLRTSTKPRASTRSTGRARIYRRGNCPVAHRSPQAAATCSNK
jgi:hypothetical protein